MRSESGRTVHQPHSLFSPTDEVIDFAGLWSVWERPDASLSISAVHHRMSVVLRPEHYAALLSS